MKILRPVAFLAGFAFLPTGITAQAEVRVLSDTEWRADITETAEAIRAHHPRPYRTNSEEVFQRAYDDLIEDKPTP
jgi:hypothetical protein